MKRSTLSKGEPQQRICLAFSRGEELKYISHLDIMRLWQRTLRRAGMPMAYSQGFNPQPRIAIAAPLAVEVTSEGEMIDIFLQRKVELDFFARSVGEQLPAGLAIVGIKELWPRLPSLQSQMCFAEYRVELIAPDRSGDAGESIQTLLAREDLPWEHQRGAKLHKYDLRHLIDDIWVVEENKDKVILGMRLRNDQNGSGRPDQVVLALGYSEPAKLIHRTKLIASND